MKDAQDSTRLTRLTSDARGQNLLQNYFDISFGLRYSCARCNHSSQSSWHLSSHLLSDAQVPALIFLTYKCQGELFGVSQTSVLEVDG